MYKKILVLTVLAASFLYAQSQNILKIEAGASLKTTGGVVITLHNTSLVNDGTLNQLAGDGTFRFTGDQNSTISGASLPEFNEIALAKTGGATLFLQRDINVVSEINFISGLFDLNNNNVHLNTGALLVGESETARITGSTGGRIIITESLNAPSASNPGNLGAVFSSAQNLGIVTVGRGHQSQVNAAGMGSSTLRYFDISPTNNAGLNAILQFHYFDAELNGLDENTLVMLKSPNNLNWFNQGSSSRNTTSNFVEKTGIGDFSRWTLAEINSIPLPLVWGSFNTRCQNDNVIINWKTLQEFNTLSFTIQRSTDAMNWTDIASLPANGNSNIEKSYSFIDNNPTAANYYRIGQTDADSRLHYSGILHVICDPKDIFKIWPNPFNDMANVIIVTNRGSLATIKIFDNKGALVKIQRTALLQGSNQFDVDMKRLTSGTYQLVIEWNKGQTKKTVQVVRQ